METEKILDMCARRFEVEGGMGFPLDPKRPLWYQNFPAW
jgi:hypothetical protein